MTGRHVTSRHDRRTRVPGGNCPDAPFPARAPSLTDGRQGPGFRSVMCVCSMPESTEDLFLPRVASHAFLDHVSGPKGG